MAITLFAAAGNAFNTELWLTDGTTGRTSLLKDIRVGVDPSGPSNFQVGTSATLPFAVLGNFAYFSATSDGNASELWRSDGTNAGTTMFASIAGTDGYSPTNIVSANGFIFFLGTGASGFGIYKTNGILAQSLVTTAVIGLTYMAAAGNNVYWAIDDGLGTSGLYTTDGVAAVSKPSSAANGVGIFLLAAPRITRRPRRWSS